MRRKRLFFERIGPCPRPTRPRWGVCCCLWLLAIAGPLGLGPGAARAADDVFQNILTRFSPYDLDGDGIWEIDFLERLSLGTVRPAVAADSRLVVVVVESRLVGTIPGSPLSAADLQRRLARFESDLRAEGYATEVVEASIYAGLRHQDGRSVLALREFLRSVKASFPNFRGVVLVGSFPEPMLVRRWLWPRVTEDGSMQIGGVTVPAGTHYLRIVPEIVSERSDLVLADLDGRWETLYQMGPMDLESVVARIPASAGTDWYRDGRTLDCPNYDRTNLSFQDFFWIRDDNYTVLSAGAGGLRIQIHTAQRHPEMNAADKALTNPLARPDLFVSRINPLHIAVNPDPAFRDDAGRGYLAADGKPQAVTTTRTIDLSVGTFWKRDEKLERKILVDYFDRNHACRVGGDSHLPFRTAAVGRDFSAAGFNDMLRRASAEFAPSIAAENASLLSYVNWLTQSAGYRGIIAHSNSRNSGFGSGYARSDLETAVGGRPWRWKKQGATNVYEPSLADQGGAADLYVHRTLWENGVLRDKGNRLYIHGGCQVNSPDGAATRPYSHDDYGTFQNAEGVLFYLNGLALCARAKVFYDLPRGFSEALGRTERSCFGEGWKGYFEEEAKDAALPALVADNKRCYTWSVLGDWTLRLRYANGLGIITLAGGSLADHAVHPNNAWIDGWDFSAALNKVEGAGDFNGDGKPDIILTSAWGMGIVSHDGTAWRVLVAYPKNTLLGAWRYNPDDNVIAAVADFDGDRKDDILVTSPWGIGILKLQSSGLTASLAKAGGTLFGSWRYEVKTCLVHGTGDFNADGKKDILMSGPSGLGVFTLQSATLAPLVVQPDGAWFGGWHYSRSGDVVAGIADFNGDGKADVLLSSSWGIGIVTVQGTTLAPLVVQPAGAWFGTWRYNPADNVMEGIGDLNADGRAELVLSSPWGIAVLKVQGTALTTVLSRPKDTWFGAWRYDPGANTVIQVADFNGDGKDDLLLSSPWGLGVLTLTGDTLTSLGTAAYGSPAGNWYLKATDRVCGAVALGGGRGAGIVLEK